MDRIDTYAEAEKFLFGRINYERVTPAGGDFKLDRMRSLLRLLGDPQERLPAVHVAGTKGKGSTAALCASILQTAGFRTGLYTSPHIARFEERMTVDGRPPDADEIVRLARRVRDAVAALDHRLGPPTFFEVVTAMGWLHFADADVVVLEVGLGGRLDSTNVCRPAVCVITSISRDHTALLGTTLDAIAREKAGIAKPGVPMISGAIVPEASATIAAVCAERGSPLFQLERQILCVPGTDPDDPAGRAGVGNPAGAPAGAVRFDAGRVAAEASGAAFRSRPFDVVTPWGEHRALEAGLAGAHQTRNAALAVAACDALVAQGWAIPPEAIRDGLRSARWPLRIEVVRRRPLVVLDAAHNWASTGALLETLDDEFPRGRRTLIFAGTRDKDVAGLLRRLLPRFDRTILTRYVSNPRGVPTPALRRLATALGHPRCLECDSPAVAWRTARRLVDDDELVCVTGSFFLAAEMRALLESSAD